MVSSPRKPRSSSCSVRVIVSSSTFSRSHSCKKTFWYGPMSSIVLTMGTGQRMLQEKTKEVNDYMRSKRLPVELRERVRDP